MRSGRFVKLLFIFWVGGLLAAVCVGAGAAFWLIARGVFVGVETSGEFHPNQIAFVGNDGNLWVATPDGSELQNVTVDARGYLFPTWSPDGSSLAFIGRDDSDKPTLFVSSDTRRPPEILFGDPASDPFYIYWSPDSRCVTFLAQEASSLALWLADVDNPGVARLMAEGAPFYWAWSPNSEQLLMHVGGARALSRDAHLSFLEKREGANREELKLAPGQFQVPLWSAGGQYVYYIAADENGDEAIYRSNLESSGHSLVTILQGSSYMTLSPDDTKIAYLELQAEDQFPALGTAYIVDAKGGESREIMRDWVVAMYWSPDGSKLALLTPAAGGEGPTARSPGLAASVFPPNRFRWWVYDVQADTVGLLTSFAPTPQFLETVPYFDQYHLSLTFWSPDSRFFVITRRDDGLGDDTVWVLDTAGEKPPRPIGPGTFAVWSWH